MEKVFHSAPGAMHLDVHVARGEAHVEWQAGEWDLPRMRGGSSSLVIWWGRPGSEETPPCSPRDLAAGWGSAGPLP
ncbi:hypothetical protein [Verrucomicrobium spinosum]|uniref:hypothetical protein n=1 Tax=Verrucomicrobium spinosum TaxID=2736 RepID=UPI000A8E04F2|nr:hypothetical protein [Verrucomicrobium spinosum]